MIWRNLWRNRRRTFITIASVMFAVLLAIVMKSLQEGVFGNLVKNIVSYYTGYVQVHKRGYWNERILDNLFEDSPALRKDLSSPQFVIALVPRIESFALTSSGNLSFGCMVAGIDPKEENKLSGLEQRLIKGKYFLDLNEPATIIGEGLARKLKLTVGDTLILLGQGYQGNIAAGKFRVKGLLHFGLPQLNDASVYLPLRTAQQWLSADNMLTAYTLVLVNTDDLDNKTNTIGQTISKDYEVMNWKQMMPEIDSHIKADTSNFYIFIGILYLIIAFGIFSTILMMANERTYEFGMLVAIGMKKWQLSMIMFGESVLLTSLGTLAGMALSLPLVSLLEKYPIRIGGNLAAAFKQYGFEPIFPAIVKSDIFISQAAIVLSMALIIGLYPLYYIWRLDVLKAMQK